MTFVYESDLLAFGQKKETPPRRSKAGRGMTTLRWIVEEDGTKILQYRDLRMGEFYWVDVPEIPAAEEYDYNKDSRP